MEWNVDMQRIFLKALKFNYFERNWNVDTCPFWRMQLRADLCSLDNKSMQYNI